MTFLLSRITFRATTPVTLARVPADLSLRCRPLSHSCGTLRAEGEEARAFDGAFTFLRVLLGARQQFQTPLAKSEPTSYTRMTAMRSTTPRAAAAHAVVHPTKV